MAFGYVAERLQTLDPLSEEERTAVLFYVGRYVDLQLRCGALANLKAVDGLYGILGVTDLPLRDNTVAQLQTWLSRFPLGDLTALGKEYRLRSEGAGTHFESAWHNDFIPNSIPDGLERAQLAFGMAYLTEKSEWVRTHGIEEQEVAALLRARETLVRLGRLKPRPGGQRGVPQSVSALLKIIDPG